MRNISRRTFVAGSAAVAGVAAIATYSRWHTPSSRPNIILFIADDMAHMDATSHTNPLMQTPNLDKLALESQAFENAFVTTSVCSVSRASILTGTHHLKHGVIFSHDSLSKFFLKNNFAGILKAQGYHTGFIGKWGFGLPPQRYFNYWKGYQSETNYIEDGVHVTTMQTSKALEFIESAPADKPFLLIVSYTAPHTPFVPQPKFSKLYSKMNIERSATDTTQDFEALPPLLKTSRGRRDYKRHELDNDAVFNRRMKDYYRLISGIDESVGLITGKLREAGLDDRSCILFTADNGMMKGEHGLFGKWCMYEESIRVPLFLRLPKAFYPQIAARKLSEIALNIDIAPSLLALAGIPACNSMQGKNLLALIKDSATEWRESFYYNHPYIQSGLMVGAEGIRSKQWKYTSYHVLRKHEEVLFNLTEDPHERINLAADKAYLPMLKEMRRKVKRAKRSVRR